MSDREAANIFTRKYGARLCWDKVRREEYIAIPGWDEALGGDFEMALEVLGLTKHPRESQSIPRPKNAVSL